MTDAIKEILNNEKKLREVVKVAFDSVDTDRSGLIDQEELEKVMAQISQDPSRIRKFSCARRKSWVCTSSSRAYSPTPATTAYTLTAGAYTAAALIRAEIPLITAGTISTAPPMTTAAGGEFVPCRK